MLKVISNCLFLYVFYAGKKSGLELMADCLIESALQLINTVKKSDIKTDFFFLHVGSEMQELFVPILRNTNGEFWTLFAMLKKQLKENKHFGRWFGSYVW